MIIHERNAVHGHPSKFIKGFCQVYYRLLKNSFEVFTTQESFKKFMNCKSERCVNLKWFIYIYKLTDNLNVYVFIHA